MAADLKLQQDTVDVEGTLRVIGSSVESSGVLGGFGFSDRANPAAPTSGVKGDRYVWYADDKTARLWSQGDWLTLGFGSTNQSESAVLTVKGRIETGEVIVKTGSTTHFVGLELKALQKRVKDLEKTVAELKAKLP